MKAAVLYQTNSPLVIEDLTIPEVSYGQVLVKLVASGICHTQILEIEGKRGVDKYLPHTLGHEGSGIVEAIGAGVKKVSVGDYVVVSWIKGSGLESSPPVYYNKNKLKINSGLLTTFNEYTVTSENRLTPIPKDIPLQLAALLGCAIPTGAGIIINTLKVHKDSSIAVFGCGGIGLSAIHMASIVGVRKIIAVDIHNEKLSLAKKLGANYTLNNENIINQIMEITDGLGVDYAIESAGIKETMEQVYESINMTKGIAVLAGNLPKGEKISIDPFHLICGKKIIGTWGGETNPDVDIPKYVNLYKEGKLKLQDFITHRFKLEEINEAIKIFKNPDVGRIIIELGN